jgi:hypothetical protein
VSNELNDDDRDHCVENVDERTTDLDSDVDPGLDRQHESAR